MSLQNLGKNEPTAGSSQTLFLFWFWIRQEGSANGPFCPKVKTELQRAASLTPPPHPRQSALTRSVCHEPLSAGQGWGRGTSPLSTFCLRAGGAASTSAAPPALPTPAGPSAGQGSATRSPGAAGPGSRCRTAGRPHRSEVLLLLCGDDAPSPSPRAVPTGTDGGFALAREARFISPHWQDLSSLAQ